MARATRFSYLFFVAVIVLAAATHLTTAADNRSLFLFCSMQTLLRKKSGCPSCYSSLSFPQPSTPWVFPSDRRSLPFPRLPRNRLLAQLKSLRLLKLRKSFASSSRTLRRFNLPASTNFFVSD